MSRDLKAENILKALDGNWLVCDFGSASTTHQVFSKPAEIAREEDNVMRNTTSAYRAPEVSLQNADVVLTIAGLPSSNLSAHDL